MRLSTAWLMAGFFWLAACGGVKHVPGKSCNVSLRIHTPPDQNTWQGVASLRITLDVPGAESQLSNADVSASQITIDGPPASGAVLTIEGLALDGQSVLSSGRSPPFELSEEQPAVIDVLFARRGEFVKLGELGQARFAHAAAALPDGRVLFFGGASAGDNASPSDFRPPEIYDPALQSSCEGEDDGCPDFPGADRRIGLSLTATPAGKVLVFGGVDEQGELVEPILLFDPSSGAFRELANYDPALVKARTGHAAALFELPDGADNRDAILIAGGAIDSGGQRLLTSGALVFDVLAESFTRTDLSMPQPRRDFSLTTFGPERHNVLVAGGRGDGGLIGSGELFDGTTFSDVVPVGEHASDGLSTPRTQHAAIATDAGVLILGGDDSFSSIDAPEMFLKDAEAGTGFFVLTAGEMPADHAARRGFIAAGLLNGKILYAGGESYDGFEEQLLSSAELAEVDQAALSVNFTDGDPIGRKFSHASVTELVTGGLLIAGGFADTPQGPSPSAEVWYYNP